MVKLLLPTCRLFAQNAPRNRTSQDLPRRTNANKYTVFLICWSRVRHSGGGEISMTQRSRFLATSTAAGLILATSAFVFAQISTPTAVRTGYAPVNGLRLYYEIHGTGEPLILLHGGVVGITMFGPNLAALSQKRKVIAVELQGHGHTADIDRPLSFETMADDMVALMKFLGIEQSDVMGYSLGGGVALQTAIRHPESVRKLVVVSAAFKRDGWYPEVLAATAQM